MIEKNITITCNYVLAYMVCIREIEWYPKFDESTSHFSPPFISKVDHEMYEKVFSMYYPFDTAFTNVSYLVADESSRCIVRWLVFCKEVI